MQNKLRLASSENQWVLDKDFYSLGRSRTADLQIKHSAASRVHIFFFNDPERGMLVSDAGSHHGTYLNERLILKPEVLSDADVIDVAAEHLHVSFDTQQDDTGSEVSAVESSVLLNCYIDDKHTDWGLDSTMQSRAVGEWLYRSIKIMMSHGGKIVKLADRSITALWEKVAADQVQQLQPVVECSRQINHYGGSLNEMMINECEMDPASCLFKIHSSLHYTPVKYKQLANGQFQVMGEDIKLMEDLSVKAAELDAQIIGIERFPSRVEDRCPQTPMLMAEVGVRKQPMVLYPLATN